MKVNVKEPTIEDLKLVLDDIRPADLMEWYAGTGEVSFTETAGAAVSSGYRRMAVRDDGLPLCFWGATETLPGVANVWLFATKTAEQWAFPIHRHLKPELKALLDQWPRLEAWADSRNTVHHTWLHWLKFQFVEEQYLGPLGMRFKLFVKEA